MYKPVYLLPCIYIYHMVSWFINVIIQLISYSIHGIKVCGKIIINGIIKGINYIIIFLKHFCYGVILSIKFIITKLITFIHFVIRGGIHTVNFLIRVVTFIVQVIIKVFTFIIQTLIKVITIIVQTLIKVIKAVWNILVQVCTYLYHLESTGIILTIYGVKQFTLYSYNKIKKGCILTYQFFNRVIRCFCYLAQRGFIFSCIRVKHFFQMVFFGVDVFSYYTRRGVEVTIDYIISKYQAYRLYRKRQREKAHQKRVEAHVAKEKKREEKERAKALERANRTEVFIDKSVVLEKKPTLGDKINKFLISLTTLPKKLNKTSIGLYFEKKNRKKEQFGKEVLNLDLLEEEKDEKKGKKGKKEQGKILYEYVAKDKNGKTVKGYFEAFNKMEVRSFLINEGLEAYSIRTNRWITLFHKDTASGNVKIKTKDLVFFLTQLSTYIKAGIPLAESLEILSRQFKNKHYQRIIKSLVYDLNLGVAFSEALEKQGKAFPRLLINMVRASEMTGSLPEVLDDQAEYFDEMEQTRKQMITAMMYPSIVFVIAIGVLTFVMLFVVPQFVDIFESMDASAIPGITLFIMNMSEFMKRYFLWILLAIVILMLIFVYLYKNVTLFRRWVQIFTMHLPVFGNVIIYNEVTTFTKTFSSLMAHNVFITDTMNILKKITNNEIYKELINDTIKNLATGEKISLAFKNHWAFPIPAYEMLVTGERTGELPEMMGKVSAYYQDLHKNAVARIKVFVEPMLIIMLTAMVGLIVLAIVVPMFKMYGAIQGS